MATTGLRGCGSAGDQSVVGRCPGRRPHPSAHHPVDRSQLSTTCPLHIAAPASVQPDPSGWGRAVAGSTPVSPTGHPPKCPLNCASVYCTGVRSRSVDNRIRATEAGAHGRSGLAVAAIVMRAQPTALTPQSRHRSASSGCGPWADSNQPSWQLRPDAGWPLRGAHNAPALAERVHQMQAHPSTSEHVLRPRCDHTVAAGILDFQPEVVAS